MPEEDLRLYTSQYHIDIVIYDAKLGDWDLESVYSKLEERYIQFLILNPDHKSGYKLKKVISGYKLFELAR